MQLTILLLVATTLLSHVLAYSVHSSAILTARSQGQELTDRFASIDLGHYETATLNKRAKVTWCISDSANLGACTGVAGFAGSVALGVAGLLKSDSDANDCKPHNGSVDDIHWNVYASGRNCDTTAQLETITGAISDYLRDVDLNVCGTHCLRLDHGGTWRGWVTIAPANQSLSTLYCGSAYTFGNKCGQGDKNDRF